MSEARAVVVVEPTGEPVPVVVEVPHAGTAVPDEVRGELLLDGDGVRRDADLYVDRLYAEAPALGATLVYTEISRFVVDLNRAPDDVDARAVAGWPIAREAPRGLIWRVATDGTPVLREPIPRASWARRVERYHAPYHAALDRVIENVRARFGRVVILSGHSMPSVGKATHGDRRGASCSPRVTAAAMALFSGAGMSVAPNEPYQGGETTRRLGRPDAGRHALQVELNRDLYMDEATFAIRDDGLARLRALCGRLVASLGEVAKTL